MESLHLSPFTGSGARRAVAAMPKCLGSIARLAPGRRHLHSPHPFDLKTFPMARHLSRTCFLLALGLPSGWIVANALGLQITTVTALNLGGVTLFALVSGILVHYEWQ